MKQYGVGTKVFCDFHFSGKPHGRIVEVITPGNGRNTVAGLVRVKISEDAGAYRKGETVQVPAWQAVPVRQEFTRGCYRMVHTNFEYVR